MSIESTFGSVSRERVNWGIGAVYRELSTFPSSRLNKLGAGLKFVAVFVVGTVVGIVPEVVDMDGLAVTSDTGLADGSLFE